MDYSTAVRRLRNHANLPEFQSSSPKEESFGYLLWQAGRKNEPINFDIIYKDIISCLETVNLTLNTNTPSKSIKGKTPLIDREISYAISGILAIGSSEYYRLTIQKKFPDIYRSELASILVRIAIAWDLVLAGDIDEIENEVETEFQIRNST